MDRDQVEELRERIADANADNTAANTTDGVFREPGFIALERALVHAVTALRHELELADDPEIERRMTGDDTRVRLGFRSWSRYCRELEQALGAAGFPRIQRGRM